MATGSGKDCRREAPRAEWSQVLPMEKTQGRNKKLRNGRADVPNVFGEMLSTECRDLSLPAEVIRKATIESQFAWSLI